MDHAADQSSAETERRFPRRFLLAVPGAGAAAAVAVAAPAEAAPASTPWMLGGNTGVTTTGSNWLGTRNVAPLIIKTTATASGSPAERMRVQPNGKVGIGTNDPLAPLDVKGAPGGGGVIRATSTSAAQAGAVRGVANVGSGFGGWFTGRGGGLLAEGIGTDGQGMYATGDYGVRTVATKVGVMSTGPTGVIAVGSGSDSTGIRADGTKYGAKTDGFYGVYSTGEIGVQGEGAQIGVYAVGPMGIYAFGTPAGHFDGNVEVSGTVSRSAATARIDHPLDPENRWLTLAGVESPDLKTVYDGTVVLDDSGEASVTLPAFVTELNDDFRYQLTCVGGHAPVYVARELRGGRFRIAGGTAGLKVCWQVTGTRRDDYARAHRPEVETEKTGDQRGTRAFVPEGSSARPMPTGRVSRDGKAIDG